MDSFLLLCSTFALLPAFGGAQLAAIFSDVRKSEECHLWSSWGPCVWTHPLKSRGRGGRVSANDNLYLSQLHPHCRNHWFYKFISEKYGTALNNVFNYLKGVTKNRKPCGMCSYRQSCGYGGVQQCHQAPTSRALLPVFVSEELCSTLDQGEACVMDYAVLKRNGGTCRIWPSTIPVLTGLDANIRNVLYKTNWGNCLPSRCKCLRDKRGRPVCRCCCFPYTPEAETFRCVPLKNPSLLLNPPATKE